MSAARKRRPHHQLDLPLTKSDHRRNQGHGGKRKGAGRPNRSSKRAHLAREPLNLNHPVHLSLRVNPGIPNLRKKESFKILRQSIAKAQSQGLHVIHFAILSNHLHLILEPQGKSLRRPLQSFGISFAKRINRLLKREGPVFHDRYHVHVLKTPTETRNALRYVLTNEAKHEQKSQEASLKKASKQKGLGANPTQAALAHRLQALSPHRNRPLIVTLDPYSSATAFQDWDTLFARGKVRFESTNWNLLDSDQWYEMLLKPAKTWLMRAGWKKARGN